MPYMDYVTREKMADKTSQLLTSFDWDFEITPPKAVYWPGDLTFKTRTFEIKPVDPFNKIDSNIRVELRGHVIIQPGLSKNDGKFNMTIQDFEDQSILALMKDWLRKCSDPETRTSFRREDLMMSMVIYRLNSSRKPVFKYVMQGIFPGSDMDYGDDMNNQKKEIGRITFGCDVEFFKTELMNLPTGV